jgi:hypothetical protein
MGFAKGIKRSESNSRYTPPYVLPSLAVLGLALNKSGVLEVTQSKRKLKKDEFLTM